MSDLRKLISEIPQRIKDQVNMQVSFIDAMTTEATFAMSGMIVEDHYIQEDILPEYRQCYHVHEISKQPHGFWNDEIEYILNLEND